jgi:hypothetical protein
MLIGWRMHTMPVYQERARSLVAPIRLQAHWYVVVNFVHGCACLHVGDGRRQF